MIVQHCNTITVSPACRLQYGYEWVIESNRIRMRHDVRFGFIPATKRLTPRRRSRYRSWVVDRGELPTSNQYILRSPNFSERWKLSFSKVSGPKFHLYRRNVFNLLVVPWISHPPLPIWLRGHWNVISSMWSRWCNVNWKKNPDQARSSIGGR